MSTKSVRFELEGQHVHGSQWSVIEIHTTEGAARKGEREYRKFNSAQKVKGWRGFRVMQVTTVRKVL